MEHSSRSMKKPRIRSQRFVPAINRPTDRGSLILRRHVTRNSGHYAVMVEVLSGMMDLCDVDRTMRDRVIQGLCFERSCRRIGESAFSSAVDHVYNLPSVVSFIVQCVKNMTRDEMASHVSRFSEAKERFDRDGITSF